MEWLDGIKLNDDAALKAASLNRKELIDKVSRKFTDSHSILRVTDSHSILRAQLLNWYDFMLSKLHKIKTNLMHYSNFSNQPIVNKVQNINQLKCITESRNQVPIYYDSNG